MIPVVYLDDGGNLHISKKGLRAWCDQLNKDCKSEGYEEVPYSDEQAIQSIGEEVLDFYINQLSD